MCLGSTQNTTAALLAVDRASHFCVLAYQNEQYDRMRFRWSKSQIYWRHMFVEKLSRVRN